MVKFPKYKFEAFLMKQKKRNSRYLPEIPLLPHYSHHTQLSIGESTDKKP